MQALRQGQKSYSKCMNHLTNGIFAFHQAGGTNDVKRFSVRMEFIRYVLCLKQLPRMEGNWWPSTY